MAQAENDVENDLDADIADTDEQDDGETLDGQDDDAGDDADGDEVVVSIGGVAPTQEDDDEAKPAPAWLKNLRKSDREKTRQLREQAEEIAILKGEKSAPAAASQIVVGERPTLAACEYDEDAYEKKLDEWHGRKQKAEAQKREAEDAQKAETESWNAKMAAHGTAKAALKVADYDEAEDVAKEILSVPQQGMIVSGADNSAILIYALGKNPAKAKELAAIKDPVKFIFAVAKLEQKLKVTPRKTAPPPERSVRGNASVVATTTDSKLAKLEAEADRTGDRSKVAAYRREQRRAK